jgi:hypothetical protein
MYILKGKEIDKPREVELVADDDGVSLVVNGQYILLLSNNHNEIVMIGGCSEALTDLKVGSSGHVAHCYDSDLRHTRDKVKRIAL